MTMPRTAASPRAGSSIRPCWTSCKGIAERGRRLVITTDHGTIRVGEPSKVVGDRNTNTNLRYKHGRNLTYEQRDVLEGRFGQSERETVPPRAASSCPAPTTS
jgi:hypothetical protein